MSLIGSELGVYTATEKRPDFKLIRKRFLSQNAFASGALPRTPLGGLQRPQTPSWKRLGYTPIRRASPHFRIQIYALAMYWLLIPPIKPSVPEIMIKSHWAPGLCVCVCAWQPTPKTADVNVTKIAGYVRVRIFS